MKKIIKLIYIIPVLLFVSCGDKYQTLQKVEGPSDCKESKGCSWNDGVVHFSSWSNENDNYFTFEIKEDGELICYYKLIEWSYSERNYNGVLTIKMGNEVVFNNSGKMANFKKISLGKVQKGALFKVYGSSSEVKDIMVIGNIEDSDSHSGWDF